MAELEDLLGGNKLSPMVSVNPLAAYAGAAETAQRVYGVREKQAQQAAGELFLQSINPDTGQPDQAKYLQLLRSSPITAMHAQKAAQDAQTLDHNTYVTQTARINNTMGAGGQLMADNPNGVPRAAMENFVKEQVTLGNLPPQLAQQFTSLISDDPHANTQLLVRGMTMALSAKDRLDAVKPPQINQNVGSAIVPLQPSPQVSTTQPPYLRPGTGVTTGPEPGTMIQTGRMVPDGHGGFVWQPGQVPANTVLPPGGQPISPPGGSSGGPAPAPPASGTRIPTGYQGRPTSALPVPPVPPASPPPAPDQRSEIAGGVNVASANGAAPTTGEGSPPSPAVAGDVAAIVQGMRNAQATPSRGTQTAQFFPSGPPMGTEKTMDANREVANTAALAMPGLRDNLIATETALKALRLSNMASGPTSSWKAQVMALLEANGLSPGDPTKMSETDWRQVAQKNLLRLAEGQAGGRTNMGLETQLHANPNMDAMLGLANEHVLIQDLGRMRQRYVMNMTMPRGGKENSSVDHVKNYGADTDYRGFAWDMMSKPERDQILKEVEKDKTGKAKARLYKAIEDADEHGLLTKPDAPPRRPQGRLVPTPQPNMLSSAFA